MKEKALLLIGIHSKSWLCDQLGINHITLNVRLNVGNWKKSEILLLETIHAKEIKLL
jgi:hypothetical protein